MTAPLAVLRFPRVPAHTKGRYAVTTPDAALVLTADVGKRGMIVDLTGPDGAPLGRIQESRRRQWHLLAPGTGLPVADAQLGNGVHLRIGAGPAARAKGQGEEWDLVWEKTTLLAVRKTPRQQAKRCLDAWVTDPACTPAVVAFAVHVRRWWAAAETANQLAVQQMIT